MNIRLSARTDVGRRRKSNEDAYLVDSSLHLYVVADGMGGHAAGEVASALAVETIQDYVSTHREEIDSFSEGTPKQRQKIRKIIKDSVRKASQKIHKEARKDKDLRGMGTTVSAMLIAGGRCYVAHVGDSRIYLVRDDEVHQMTTDHNLVNEMIRAGRLDPSEAESTPFTNALTRAVGVYPAVEVDTLELELMANDAFLLCSDGLHGYFDDASIAEAWTQDLETRADWLVEFANEKGGKDNITALIVELGEMGDPEAGARLRLTIDTLHRIPLFQHLAYAELVQLINVCRAREVGPGEVLIRQGDEGDALYVILSGRVSVEKGDRMIAVLGPGRHFGEMSLVDNQPRSATVRTIDRSVLIRIVRADFYDTLKQDSVLAVKLLWNFIQTLSARLRDANAENLFEEYSDTIDNEMHPYNIDQASLTDALAVTSPGMDVPEAAED